MQVVERVTLRRDRRAREQMTWEDTGTDSYRESMIETIRIRKGWGQETYTETERKTEFYREEERERDKERQA